MHHYSLIAIFVIFSTSSCTNTGKKKEGNSSTEEFADLADKEEFRNKHEKPGRELRGNTSGEMIDLKIKGENNARAYMIKSAKESDKWLFVIHEWWGLNAYVKHSAQEYFDSLENVNVLALVHDKNIIH